MKMAAAVILPGEKVPSPLGLAQVPGTSRVISLTASMK